MHRRQASTQIGEPSDVVLTATFGYPLTRTADLRGVLLDPLSCALPLMVTDVQQSGSSSSRRLVENDIIQIMRLGRKTVLWSLTEVSVNVR